METCNEWLEFEGRKAPVYYLCGFIPGSVGEDELSPKILSFKAGSFQAKQFWLNHMLNKCRELLIKDESDLFCRALSSDELTINVSNDYKTPLGYLCTRSAKLLRARYASGMLHKISMTPTLKGLSKHDRWELVKDNYRVSERFVRRKFMQFWFVDDVITTGATARAAWKALLEYYPDIDFRVLALARTVHDQAYNETSTLIADYKEMLQQDLLVYESEEQYCSQPPRSGLAIPEFSNEGTFFV